jgi:hypothetical protein
VTFEVEDDAHRWVLRAKDGSALCELPCSRWVPPKSGWVVDRMDEPGISYRAWIPDEPRPYGGQRYHAQIYPKRGSELGPAIMLYAGGSTAFILLAVGTICASAVDNHCGMSTGTQVGLIAGPTIYLGGALWWFLWSRSSTKFEWEPEAPTYAAAKRKTGVGPGFVYSLARDGSGFVLGPGILAGAF